MSVLRYRLKYPFFARRLLVPPDGDRSLSLVLAMTPNVAEALVVPGIRLEHLFLNSGATISDETREDYLVSLSSIHFALIFVANSL